MKAFTLLAVVVFAATAVWYITFGVAPRQPVAPPVVGAPTPPSDPGRPAASIPETPQLLVPPTSQTSGLSNDGAARATGRIQPENTGVTNAPAPVVTLPPESNVGQTGGGIRPPEPATVMPSEPEPLKPIVEKPLETVSIPETPIVPREAIVPTQAQPSNSEFVAVQRVVARFEQVYRDLDANAAASIWPTVDARGLARAFARIARQDLRFDTCAFSVVESRATATCAGSLTYVPRVGNPDPRTEHHAWSIDLERAGGQWQIVDVKAR